MANWMPPGYQEMPVRFSKKTISPISALPHRNDFDNFLVDIAKYFTIKTISLSQISSAGEESKESKVLNLIQKMKEQIPENLDYDGTVKIFGNDKSPLKVVLLQEIQRYNNLLDLIRTQLLDLEKGIQGLVVMSSELEEIFAAIFENHVPIQWQYVIFPSYITQANFSNRRLNYKIQEG